MKARAITACVVLAVAAPAAAAEPWRAWPSWTFVEAGSVELRARIETTWGGLGALVDPGRHGDLRWLDLAEHVAAEEGVAGAAIDRARPMRVLARPRAGRDGGLEVAVLFAVSAGGTDRAPDECAVAARADARALVCGADEPAAALRDDFLARGGPSLDARALHGELANDRGEPVRATFDATEDDAGLHLHERAIARTSSPAVALSAGARAAAVRMAAWPSDVTATVIDDGTSKVDGAYFFLDRPFARVFADELAQLRASARLSTADASYRFAIDAAPAGLPRGARIVRTRLAVRSPGVVMVCTPEPRQYGECTRRRVPRHTDVETYALALVPDGDGTWMIDPAGDARAFFAAAAPPTAMPPAWTTTARELGVENISRSHARIWWARTRGHGAEVTLDVEGRAP